MNTLIHLHTLTTLLIAPINPQVCSHTGCGRYTMRHAEQHFHDTHHPFSLELATGEDTTLHYTTLPALALTLFPTIQPSNFLIVTFRVI